MNLEYFETIDSVSGDISYNRPETKTLGDLERVLNLGKDTSIIDKFIYMYLEWLQWEWFEVYQEYLTNLDEITLFNENLSIIATDEEGNDIFAEPLDIPIEPIRPNVITLSEFKELNPELFNTYEKIQGVTIQSEQVSLNENNQNGIASVLTGLNLAAEINIEMFPIVFKADSPSGIVTLPFSSIDEFKAFALTFMSERQKFFK